MLSSENVLAYTSLDKALKEVKDKANNTLAHNVNYFYGGDNYLSYYVNSVRELRESMANFNNLFEDLMMEIEEADRQKWEEAELEIEQDYYSEVQNGRLD